MQHTQIFRDLHLDSTHPLILPNVWDAGGARLVESLGAKAVATTSAGVAWSKGYPDGNVMPPELQARLAAEIVQAVKIPVSVDVEAGYSNDPATVAGNILPILAAGISGINLEDGTDAPEILARKIAAIKQAASAHGLDVFINARTDVYLQDLVADKAKVEESLKRSKIYQDAGADGFFVPGLTHPDEIARITAGSGLPVNLMSAPSLPKLEELTMLGVRRLSAGGTIARILYKHMERLSRNFLQDGDSSGFDEDLMQYGEMQALFGK